MNEPPRRPSRRSRWITRSDAYALRPRRRRCDRTADAGAGMRRRVGPRGHRADRRPRRTSSAARAQEPAAVRPVRDLRRRVAPRPGRQHARMQTPLPIADEAPEVEPSIDLDAIAVARAGRSRCRRASSTRPPRASLSIYERELATVDEQRERRPRCGSRPAGCASGSATPIARARTTTPRCSPIRARPPRCAACAGSRARAATSLEATRQLDAELAVAGALERRPLAHYRIDLLIASGEQDLARVAVGELLDQRAVGRPRAARAARARVPRRPRRRVRRRARAARPRGQRPRAARGGAVGARRARRPSERQRGAPRRWFAAAAESDPASLAARLGAIRQAAAPADGDARPRALLDLARQVEPTDPTPPPRPRVRAQQWAAAASPALPPRELATGRGAARSARRRGSPPRPPSAAADPARGAARSRTGRDARPRRPSAPTPPRAPPSSIPRAAPSCGRARSRSIPATTTPRRSCAPRTSRPRRRGRDRRRPRRRRRRRARARPAARRATA